jgi:heme-binding protein
MRARDGSPRGRARAVRVRILAAIALLLAAAQAVRFEESNPPVAGDLHPPPGIATGLRSACYDCHSNETRWPWYSSLAPLSWLVHYDVSEGRRRLNFSRWSEYLVDPGTRTEKLEHIRNLVVQRDMPPWYYRAIHRSARWTDLQRDEVLLWVDAEIAAPPVTP